MQIAGHGNSLDGTGAPRNKRIRVRSEESRLTHFLRPPCVCLYGVLRLAHLSYVRSRLSLFLIMCEDTQTGLESLTPPQAALRAPHSATPGDTRIARPVC